jgi:hypothetical protein
MGTATTIEGQAVVTSLGPGPMAEGGAEFLRLRAELLEGAGFFIAKVTPRPGHSGGCPTRIHIWAAGCCHPATPAGPAFDRHSLWVACKRQPV